MARIRDDVRQQIIDRSDIVEVIADHVHLIKSGSRFKALCPFHKEKTPSFTVDPDKQMFYCFGCQTGGDVLKFIQLQENLDFVGALEFLGRRCGVRLEWTGKNAPERTQWDHGLLQEALDYYQEQLKKNQSEKITAVLKKRGLSRELVEIFQIGYADPSWDSLLDYFRKRGVEPERLKKVGLVAEKNGRYRDWFRDRLLFPILTAGGQVVGFGGRAFEDVQPKYLNSPESGRFQKGRLLYALNLARKAMGEKKYGLLAEGYMDVVTLHSFGFTHSVGSLGTALTLEQARVLKRYIKMCYLVYDGDSAGRKAAARAVDIMRDADLPCRIICLPDGDDPDDFLHREGPESFQQLIDQAVDGFDYRLASACQQHGADNLEGRRAVAAEIGQWILAVPSEIAKTEYWGRLSECLKTPVHALMKEVRRMKVRPAQSALSGEAAEPAGADSAPLPKPGREQLAKYGLAALLLEESRWVPQVRKFWKELDQEEEEDRDESGQLIERILALYEQNPEQEPEQIRGQLEDDGLGQLVTRILMGDPVPENREKAFQEYCRVIRYHQLQQRIARQTAALQSAGEQSETDGLFQHISKRNQLEKERYGLGERG